MALSSTNIIKFAITVVFLMFHSWDVFVSRDGTLANSSTVSAQDKFLAYNRGKYDTPSFVMNKAVVKMMYWSMVVMTRSF